MQYYGGEDCGLESYGTSFVLGLSSDPDGSSAARSRALLEFILQFRFFRTALALENAMPDQSDAQNEPPLVASDPGTTGGETRVSALETNLMKVAEELGTWLGTAERKTTDFLAQRDITEHLVKIRDTAARLLDKVEKARERSR
jgi:hypothetical protein